MNIYRIFRFVIIEYTNRPNYGPFRAIEWRWSDKTNRVVFDLFKPDFNDVARSLSLVYNQDGVYNNELFPHQNFQVKPDPNPPIDMSKLSDYSHSHSSDYDYTKGKLID